MFSDTDLSSSAAAAARIHLPPLAAADAAAADEVLLGEEGDGGEERRAAEGQQDGVHDAASRLGREHSSPEVRVIVTPDSLDNLNAKTLVREKPIKIAVEIRFICLLSSELICSRP